MSCCASSEQGDILTCSKIETNKTPANSGACFKEIGQIKVLL